MDTTVRNGSLAVEVMPFFVGLVVRYDASGCFRPFAATENAVLSSV